MSSRNSAPARTASTLAAEAVTLVDVDTRRAHACASSALEASRTEGDPAAGAVAERVLGIVCREEGSLADSILHFRRAITLASRAGSTQLAGEARIGLMAALAIGGDWRGAISEGGLAITALRGADRARAQSQLATVFRRQGRFDEALKLYGKAVHELRAAGDKGALAKLYNNRAGAHFYRGALAAALLDYEQADRLFRAAGLVQPAATAREGWGVVVSRRGELAAALAAFAEADELRGTTAAVDPLSLRDRAMVLLAARLVGEALSYLRQSVAALQSGGQESSLAEAQVLLAEAALLDGQAAEALAAADQACHLFVRHRRTAWAALARSLLVRASWEAGERSPGLLHSARRTADELATAGFAIAAADARLLASHMALELGKAAIARRELDVARRARQSGPVDLRARAWHAEALLRLHDGNRRGAWSALRAGIQVLDRYRTSLAATDLRVHAAGHGEGLTGLGIRLAVEEGDPHRVLAWTERCRAISQRPRLARPPRDARLAAELAELRQAVAATHEAALAGQPTGHLLARQVKLEGRVRDRARHATGSEPASVASPPEIKELAVALGDRVLVELVENDGVLHAVTVAGRRVRLVRLAERDTVLAELDAFRFALRRLAFGRGSANSMDAAADAALYGLKRLDGLLMAPLAADVDGHPVVIVPTAPLHAAPWSTLPSLAGRPVCVAPSAAVWLASSSAPETHGGDFRVVLVAGPDLAYATREVAAIARRHPAAIRLTGRRATSEAVARAVDGADLAHVAAHGRFRADNPLFSCVQLADGPVTVYDMENLEHPPRTLVLSACDSGVSDVHPGDEVMGFVASVLAMGTRSVVASICPVPDDATRRLMLAFHSGIAKGSRPATALAAAQQRLITRSPRDLAAAAAFVCFGVG